MLDSTQETTAAEKYLIALSHDASVRERYLACGHDEAAVAREMAATTGMAVAPANLAGIAKHLTTTKAADVNKLADAYPAMNMIVIKTT